MTLIAAGLRVPRCCPGETAGGLLAVRRASALDGTVEHAMMGQRGIGYYVAIGPRFRWALSHDSGWTEP